MHFIKKYIIEKKKRNRIDIAFLDFCLKLKILIYIFNINLHLNQKPVVML